MPRRPQTVVPSVPVFVFFLSLSFTSVPSSHTCIPVLYLCFSLSSLLSYLVYVALPLSTCVFSPFSPFIPGLRRSTFLYLCFSLPFLHSVHLSLTWSSSFTFYPPVFSLLFLHSAPLSLTCPSSLTSSLPAFSIKLVWLFGILFAARTVYHCVL